MAKRNKPFPEITKDRLRATEAIKNLEWCEQELRGRYRELDLGEIPALKEYAAIQRWKIDKVLPSPKAIEVSGSLAVDTTIRVRVSGDN